MSENKKLIPKRRFKEFQNADAWEECELGEVVFVNSGRDYKHLSVGNIPVYGTGGYMLSVNNKLSDEDAVGIGRKGSIDNPQYLRAPFWTVDTLFFLTPKEEMNLRFFYAMAQGIKWRQFDESTGVPSLSKVNIEKITKNFPKIEEQEIIGQFFKNLDQTIAFQQRKLEKMKSMKSAYLSEMFPAEGERKPKRRFPGFTDDWEQRELGEVAEVLTGKAFSSTDFSKNGQYLVITNKNIQDQTFGSVSEGDRIDISESDVLEKYSLSGENILVTMDGVNIGKVGRFSDSKAVLAQRVGRLKSNNMDFIFTLVDNEKFLTAMNKVSVGNAIKHISLKQISEYKVFVPIEAEQERIGTFFSSLDQTIAFQQQKLEKLQNIKKAYLNEMFI